MPWKTSCGPNTEWSHSSLRFLLLFWGHRGFTLDLGGATADTMWHKCFRRWPNWSASDLLVSCLQTFSPLRTICGTVPQGMIGGGRFSPQWGLAGLTGHILCLLESPSNKCITWVIGRSFPYPHLSPIVYYVCIYRLCSYFYLLYHFISIVCLTLSLFFSMFMSPWWGLLCVPPWWGLPLWCTTSSI